MSSNFIGMYSCFENQLDFNVRVRLVKYENGVLYHTTPLKISREMIQDLKLYGIDVEYQVLETLKSEERPFFEMSEQDIKHASNQIQNLFPIIRDMKIRKILQD